MNMINKLLLGIFAILFLVIVGELFIFFNWGGTKNQLPGQNKLTPSPAPTLKPESIAFLKNPLYQRVLPLVYDAQKDRIYIDTKPGRLMGSLRNMAIDFASWVSLMTYTKGQTAHLIIDLKLQGVVSKVKYIKNPDGTKRLQYNLTGKDGKDSVYSHGEALLRQMKFVKIVSGKEVAMDPSELKDGDSIAFEVVSDWTRSPIDPNPSDKMKFTKLETKK